MNTSNGHHDLFTYVPKTFEEAIVTEEQKGLDYHD
jgi:hypothetical protein